MLFLLFCIAFFFWFCFSKKKKKKMKKKKKEGKKKTAELFKERTKTPVEDVEMGVMNIVVEI